MTEWRDSFIRTDWGRLHYVTGGSGEPLVLLHSGGASAWEYEHVFERLCEKYRVFLWDMPGHGYSDRITTHHSIEDYSRVLIGFLDALGLGKVYLAGVSVGANITVDMAVRHAGRVRLAGVIEAPLRDAKWYDDNWLTFEEMCAFPLVEFEKLAPRFRDLTQELFTRWSMDRSKAGAWTLVDLAWAVRDYDLAAAIPLVTTPMVVMFGAKGPTRSGEASYREMAPGATYVTLAECGHFPMIDDPAAFAEALISADGGAGMGPAR